MKQFLFELDVSLENTPANPKSWMDLVATNRTFLASLKEPLRAGNSWTGTLNHVKQDDPVITKKLELDSKYLPEIFKAKVRAEVKEVVAALWTYMLFPSTREVHIELFFEETPCVFLGGRITGFSDREEEKIFNDLKSKHWRGEADYYSY